MSSIDVVVPCYRYGHYLRECVQSVLTQDVGELRVLILDDESPDETFSVGTALAAEDPRVSYRRHSANRGHIATFNEGIEWCRADYMLLLSADDYLLPGALKRAVDLMDANRGVGLCFGHALCLQQDGAFKPMRVRTNAGTEACAILSGSDFVKLCVRAGANNIVCTPTAVVKTDLLKKWGGYRADLPHSGDLEMWLRLSAYAAVGLVKSDQAVYRRHAGNMSDRYFEDDCLSDLLQRKAAFDAYYAVCGAALPEVRPLYLSLVSALAREAVGHAGSAFNGNRMALSNRLQELAVGMHPPVRRTAAWAALRLKELLGFRVSIALVQAIKWFRSLLARVRNRRGQSFSSNPPAEVGHEH